ncbi:MAG: hypothetical protein HFI86_05060 [Bacilli bacterium]|nr:hypothetical protein [Bacilli bacterium]
MKKRQLTKDIYNQYYNQAYIFSLLVNNDVISKLESDYSSGFVLEEHLLNEIRNLLKENGNVFLSDDRIKGNLYKIIGNSSDKNVKWDIISLLNGIDFNSNYSYPFLRTQYLFRKYGFNNMSRIKLFKKYLDEARNLSNIFLINSQEQLYDSIAFDFKLISSLPKLEDNPKLIYDECLNNYKLFASLNYFKLEYPDIFNDKSFLKFVRDITESQSIENHESNNENCLFADFYVENQKTLNYVNRRLKRL